MKTLLITLEEAKKWEKEFDESFAKAGVIGGRKLAEYLPDTYDAIKSFIRKVVEQAREETTLKERSEITAELSIRDAKVEKRGFEAGRTAALNEVVEMIDIQMEDPGGFIGALLDLKQSITSLIEKK